MLRITGILIGSALAVALLVVVLGPPRIGSQPAATAVWQETQTKVSEPVAQAQEIPEPVVELPPEPLPETAAEPEPVAEPVPEVPADTPSTIDESLVDAIFAPVEERQIEVIQENWYAFWSPFRSEIAANGFVEQLQRTTGLDYRVVKQKPGVYEVAFAYDDAVDIEDKLAMISAATGLEMPGG